MDFTCEELDWLTEEYAVKTIKEIQDEIASLERQKLVCHKATDFRAVEYNIEVLKAVLKSRLEGDELKNAQ